ncbi:RNA polymerase-associated protein RTF1 homolog [Hippoglossus hippoglossus]|uniref:RNA polymerase-associated protein RTF1 homolog n=1 Tax=Hippoglossus hippoglossus TaxID=8267 RepID=UPI00148D45A4|nr:RNA polymerase-associated protein RTF1 homolog [Hippoglossus hippoglossus]
MSSVAKTKFVVAGAASAVSGRSAGTKRKRQVEHDQGPVEKKARGEETQPALRPASAVSGRSAGTKRKRQVEHGQGPVEKKARGEETQPALRPASAVSGRSAGTKRKRQVEHGQGPVEKKARGEETQPALRPEELKRICLSYNRLEQWCHMPFFATTVTGCFVRAVTDPSISDPLHAVAEIVSVMETRTVYQFGSQRTNMAFKLRHAGREQIVTLRSASNQEFTISEFTQWKQAMMAAGIKVPTPDMIANKEKSIKEALDHTFTEREIDSIVAQKNLFQTAPLNFAKSKIELLAKQRAARNHGDAAKVKEIQDELETLNKETKQLYQPRTTEPKRTFPSTYKSRRAPAPKAQIEDYHNMDPFTRRKTRPIVFTSLKKDSVRQAVYAELDSRYGFGFKPENTEDCAPPPSCPHLPLPKDQKISNHPMRRTDGGIFNQKLDLIYTFPQ